MILAKLLPDRQLHIQGDDPFEWAQYDDHNACMTNRQHFAIHHSMEKARREVALTIMRYSLDDDLDTNSCIVSKFRWMQWSSGLHTSRARLVSKCTMFSPPSVEVNALVETRRRPCFRIIFLKVLEWRHIHVRTYLFS